MSDPFRNASSGMRISEFLGCAMLAKPIELHQGVKTKHGEADAMETDLVILNPEKGTAEVVTGVLIFQKILVGDLKRRVGDTRAPLVLGVLSQKPNTKDPDGRPTWIFQQVEDPEVVDMARKFVADHPEWSVPADVKPEPVTVPATVKPSEQAKRRGPAQPDYEYNEFGDEPPF